MLQFVGLQRDTTERPNSNEASVGAATGFPWPGPQGQSQGSAFPVSPPPRPPLQSFFFFSFHVVFWKWLSSSFILIYYSYLNQYLGFSSRHSFTLSITNSQSLLKLMSMESVMPSNHLNLCCPLLLPTSIFPNQGLF